MSNSYKDSGVNIEAGNEVVKRIKSDVASTHTSAVLTGIGSFGGLYDIGEVLKSYKNPVLVQSIDGVGTKLTVAKMANKFNTVGEDIVNHCVNDLLAMGARPLTFLDYVANENLVPEIMEAMVSGMSKACRENSISLLGGETAEMPGTYAKDEHDIAGAITGVVEKDKIITGENIKEGDIVLGFSSSGLHTNGYSLARKILFKDNNLNVNDKPEELGETIGEALLKVHVGYARPVLDMLDNIAINGIAHITGGGFIDNISRVLPPDLNVEIQKGSWPEVPIFSYLQKLGNLGDDDLYRAFNMGIGLVLIINKSEQEKVNEILKNYPEYKIFEIGKVVKGVGEVNIL